MASKKDGGKRKSRPAKAAAPAAPTDNGGKKVTRNARGQIQPGSVLNPTGRPKSARSKLSESFIAALAKDFEENGQRAIRSVRMSKPGEYLRVIASIVPKQVETEDEDGNAVGVALITKGAIEALIERGQSDG
jgi:hypothetical protein